MPYQRGTRRAACGGGGRRVNEVQRIAFSPTPDHGTWRLDYDNVATATVPWNASAGDVQTALEGVAGIGAGNVAVTGSMAAGFTVTFQGELAHTNVPELQVTTVSLGQAATTVTVETLTPGTDPTAETWTVTLPACDSGFWQPSTSIGSTTTLAWDAPAATVQSTLGGMFGSCVVIGPDGGPYTVTFDAPGPVSPPMDTSWGALTLGGDPAGNGSIDRTPAGTNGTQEVQRLTLADHPTGGVWFPAGGTTFGPAPSDPADTVEYCIEGELGQGVAVTGSNGGPYTVTWDQGGDRPALVPDGSELVVACTGTVTVVQNGG